MMIKDTLHAIKRQWHLKRFGVDIDVEYEPLSDEDLLEDARCALDSLKLEEEWILELKENPVRNFLAIRDHEKSISFWKEMVAFDAEYLEERGLSL